MTAASTDDGDLQARQALATAARTRVVESVEQVLGEQLRLDQVESGQKPDYYDDGIVVGAHGLAERCPRRAVNPAQDYEDSVATARRRVGLLVLRAAYEGDGRAGTDPATRVRSDSIPTVVQQVLDDPSGWPRNLRVWVEGLDRAGRAVLAAAVTTWSVGVLRLVGGRPGIVWADPAITPRWNLTGRLVALTAPLDATAGRPRTGERLLSVSEATAQPLLRVRAAHVALVRALTSGVAPTRVTVASPAAGTLTPIPVDDALLSLGVDRVAEFVGHHLHGDRAVAVPGPGCAHCHLLELCPEGSDLLAGDARVASVGAGPDAPDGAPEQLEDPT